MLNIKGVFLRSLLVFTDELSPPPPIQGTGITLHTEEDIAKWVAERRLRWPSAKRAAAKVSYSLWPRDHAHRM